MKSIVTFSILLFMAACNTHKAISEQSTAQQMEENKKMIEAGYLMGTVLTYSKEGNCPYIIEVAADTPYYLDPTNLDEAYQKADMKIWFTFSGLRMMNRCEKASPIRINDIKKRAE